MKIVLSPDKFKGSLSGIRFCRLVEEVIKERLPEAEVISLPLADGGDGTLEVIEHYYPHARHSIEVIDPLMRKIRASYLFEPKKGIAFIEMAEASGLRLLQKEEQNCFRTSSYGVGQLIKHALDLGAQQLVIGLGGSATNDAGMGMAAALGYQFQDAMGKELLPIGKNLAEVNYIVSAGAVPRLQEVGVVVLCDVENPLIGKEGATRIYGPQKGADQQQIEQLEQGMHHFSTLLKEQLNADIAHVPGAGAAGGLGAGTMVFLGAQLEKGGERIKELVNYDTRIEGADWIIGGEGRLDASTFHGKTIQGLLSSARTAGARVALFCGDSTLTADEAKSKGIDYLDTIMSRADNLKDAIEQVENYLPLIGNDFCKQAFQK